jgi:hypothetical protein
MTIEKTFQGAWKISDIHDNQLLSRQYLYYTKKEAIKLFKLYKLQIKKGN